MRLKKKQIFGVVFLLLALVISQIPASFVEAIGTTSDLKKDGNAIISYTGTASAVSVPNGIETICSESFSNHTEMKSVTFPKTLKKIENGAFRGCANLQQVYLGQELETLESGAFSMCKSLSKVVFSPTLSSLGAGVFSGDSSLVTLDLNKNPNYLFEDGALYNKDKTKLYCLLSGRKLESYHMPDSVKEVERYAFWGCDSLRSVSLSSNLAFVPEYAFSNCSQLEEITIPFSVRSIAAKAFEDCVSLENITIPPSVSSIHPTAFDGCVNVHILAQEGTFAYTFAQEFENSLTSSLEVSYVSENSIGSYYNQMPQKQKEEDKTEGKTGTQKKTFDPSKPADVSDAEVSVYYANDAGDVLAKTRVVNNQAVILKETQKGNEDGIREDLKDSIVCDSLIEDLFDHVLPFKAYYESTSLSKPALAKGFTELGDLAFARSSVEQIVLPQGLKKIGYGAFYHCDLLTDVEIPSSVTDIGPEAFAHTPYLHAFLNSDVANDFLVVGDGVLIGYKGTKENVTIPGNVKKIAGGVFKDHTEITCVIFPTSLIEIGEGAFEGCTKLTKMNGMDQVQKICDRAFYQCPLSSLHLAASLKQIGLGAFSKTLSNSVVFEAKDQIPTVSYEKTATILDHALYRIAPFDFTTVAVVSDSIHSFSNSVLDEKVNGFKGLVVSILPEDTKAVKLQYCTLLPDESTGVVMVPQNVVIDDKSYRIASISPNAFKAYRSYKDWGTNEITAISLPPDFGTIDSYEPGLNLAFSIDKLVQNADLDAETSSNQAASLPKEDKNDEQDTKLIQIQNMSSFPNADRIQANCLDDTTEYILSVTDCQDNTPLKSAVEATYGILVSGQLQTIDLTMLEKTTNVPISLFGKQQVELWIPVSDTMFEQDICMVALKESGELETIFGTKKKKDELSYFVFRTNHFSTYGLYAGIGDTAKWIRAESEKLLTKDASPETGEKTNPKWFLCIAFAAIGLLLLINKKKLPA